MDTRTETNSSGSVADRLATVLADTYTLMLKTQGYHWNVTGPAFKGLHDLFGAQYQSLHLAADEVAERIRALGRKAPASWAAFAERATIAEDVGAETAEAMVGALAADHAALTRSARAAFETAEEAGDQVSADMMVGRITKHDKAAWMLRSSLG
ncbi:MAG: DNA starvation/stationary phase protection protein [Proteobacteria bacterium]|nr:DNA starvation/stationary phase protection protein [Pseudomonadota bacterium]